MQKISKAYQTQIKKVPFRNRTFIEVSVGVLNKEAQKNAKFDKTLQYMEFSNLEAPFEKEKVKKRYGAYESNYIIPDGNLFIFAEKNYTLYQGAVRKPMQKSIIIDLGDTYELAGLTASFGIKYPTRFNLILDDEVREIENHKKEWIYTTPLTTRYIEIEPLEYVGGGYARLRIENFKCGYGKDFNNTNITNLHYEESFNPVSSELTLNDLQLEAENYGRKIDIEKEGDLSSFLIVGQDVNVNYGYELNDGKIEYLDYGNLSLKEWSIDSERIKITATSQLNTLDENCMIGTYSEEGKSLYDLAVEIFNDLGLQSKQYSLDTRLKMFKTKNPLPQLPHNQLLQLIANAGQCALIRDRNNAYKMIPTCFNSTEDVEFTISDNGHTENSNPQRIIDLVNNIKTTYGADYSQDFIRLDNKMYFADASDIGYISSEVANAEGIFETNPKITITTNKSFQFLGWTFDFVGAVPQEMIIKTFYNGEKIYERIFNPYETIYKADDNYGQCDKIEIEFAKGAPNARIHIANITTPPIVFNFTTSRDVIGSTTATIKNNVKMVELETTQYIKDEEKSDCYTSEIEIEDGIDYTNFEIVFSNAIVPDKFYVNETEITPISYTGQHCYIDLSSHAVGDIIQFKVNGYNLTTKNKTYRKSLGEKGTTESYNNPLIDNEVLARANLNWLGVYEGYNKTYEIENRGYPELELNDLVGLEIPQLNKMATVRIISQSLDFSGGALSAKTTAVREV